MLYFRSMSRNSLSHTANVITPSSFDWSSIDLLAMEAEYFEEYVHQASLRQLDITEHPDFEAAIKRHREHWYKYQKREAYNPHRNSEKAFLNAVQAFRYYLAEQENLSAIPYPISIDLACRYIEFRAYEAISPIGGNTTLDYAERIKRYLSRKEKLAEEPVKGVSVSTLQRDTWALATLSKQHALPSPTNSRRYQQVLRRTLDQLAANGRETRGQAVPFTKHYRDHIKLRFEQGDERLQLRDLLICQFMFEAMLRGEELQRLQHQHIMVLPGIGMGANIRLDWDKTNKSGIPRYLPLSPYALQLYQRFSQDSPFGSEPSQYLLTTAQTRGYERVSMSVFYASLQRITTVLKQDGLLSSSSKPFTTHSFRIGSAIWLTQMGKSPAEIMLAGRWSSLKMLLRYIEPYRKAGAMADLADQF